MLTHSDRASSLRVGTDSIGGGDGSIFRFSCVPSHRSAWRRLEISPALQRSVGGSGKPPDTSTGVSAAAGQPANVEGSTESGQLAPNQPIHSVMFGEYHAGLTGVANHKATDCFSPRTSLQTLFQRSRHQLSTVHLPVR